jgi:hypothetical protein
VPLHSTDSTDTLTYITLFVKTKGLELSPKRETKKHDLTNIVRSWVKKVVVAEALLIQL